MADITILTPEQLAERERQAKEQHVDGEAPQYAQMAEEDTAAVPTAHRHARGSTHVASSFEQRYPNIAYFVAAVGWIHLGRDDDSPLTSVIRALDPGGMAWEGQDTYP